MYIDHLRGVSMFEQFSRKDLERIARASDEVSVPAGTVILKQGTEGHEAYVVLKGTVTVTRNGRKVTTLGSGAILGELALLDHGQRSATATCATPCDLLVLTQSSFLVVVMDVPQLANKLLVTLVSRIRDLDKLSLG